MRYFQAVLDAIEYIEANLGEELGVHDVTERSGLSSWHFQRIFRDTVHETIGSYLRRRRLAASLETLRTSRLKVIDVAMEYQFGSSEAYSRAFKEEFGLSPQQFRDQKPKIIPYKKPALTKTQLEYVAGTLKLEPEIRKIAPITVVGLPITFVSPLAKRLEYMKVIPEHWRAYMAREPEIEHKVGAVKVGYISGIASPKHHVHDDMMEYIAGTAVDFCRDPPPGLVKLVIPGGTYAVFEGRGFHEQTQYLVDHVYSTWLPQADLQRADGPEFTWLDHTHEPLDPKTSKVLYFLPVK